MTERTYTCSQCGQSGTWGGMRSHTNHVSAPWRGEPRTEAGLLEAARAVIEWATYYPNTGNASVPAGFMRTLERAIEAEAAAGPREHDRTHGGTLVVPHPEDPDCHWPATHDMDEYDPACAMCRRAEAAAGPRDYSQDLRVTTEAAAGPRDLRDRIAAILDDADTYRSMDEVTAAIREVLTRALP